MQSSESTDTGGEEPESGKVESVSQDQKNADIGKGEPIPETVEADQRSGEDPL